MKRESDSYNLQAHQMVNDVHRGDMKAVIEKLNSGIHPDDYGTNSIPALICASCKSHSGAYDMVKLLLEHGADPNKYTPSGLSALKSAANATNKNLKIIELLLSYKADPNFKKEGKVPLILACDSNTYGEDEIKIIKLLLPLTDKKYHQQAYEYCADDTARKLFGDGFIEPKDGFGGPNYKYHLKYSTPPKHPLLRQVWELVDIFVQRHTDPTYSMGVAMNQTCLIRDSETYISDLENNTFDGYFKMILFKVFNWYDQDDKLKVTYPDIYEMVKNYSLDDSDSSSDSSDSSDSTELK